jgi:hypothetical protein
VARRAAAAAPRRCWQLGPRRAPPRDAPPRLASETPRSNRWLTSSITVLTANTETALTHWHTHAQI